MGFNWGGIGTAISGVVNALGSAGIMPGSNNFNSIVSAVTGMLNANQQAELQICSQILAMAGNPAIVAELSLRLATMAGIPQAAANLALQLTAPGANVVQIVLEIEQIIKQGG